MAGTVILSASDRRNTYQEKAPLGAKNLCCNPVMPPDISTRSSLQVTLPKEFWLVRRLQARRREVTWVASAPQKFLKMSFVGGKGSEIVARRAEAEKSKMVAPLKALTHQKIYENMNKR